MLGITIRIGASHDQVKTADGMVFDRSRMKALEKKKLSRLVTAIYKLHLERKTAG